MQRIIYKQDNGVIAVVIPSPDVLLIYGINAVAQKDVPHGKPYKIVDESEIPSDRSLRAAWTVDDLDLTDGFGAFGSTF